MHRGEVGSDGQSSVTEEWVTNQQSFIVCHLRALTHAPEQHCLSTMEPLKDVDKGTLWPTWINKRTSSQGETSQTSGVQISEGEPSFILPSRAPLCHHSHVRALE